MKYTETNFRAIYNKLCIFPIDNKVKNSLKEFEGYEKANILLGYGYIDHEAGLTIEVLCLGIENNDERRMFKGNDEITIKLRIGSLENLDFDIIDDNTLLIEFEDKIEMIKDCYSVSEGIEESRKMEFLDLRRHPYYPDDVLVFIFKEGLEPEGIWAKICDLDEEFNIIGKILNEPNQNFGYHVGDKISFFVEKNEKGEIGLLCNLNPTMKLKAKDLEGGCMLKEAIISFNKDQNNETFFNVIELLRDSYVWIPCNEMSDEDYGEIEKMGKRETKLIPDILKNGDDLFLPVFSSCEEMDEYGDGFSKVKMHMLEAVMLALKNKKNLRGIVVNAFTDPFVLEKELFEPFEKLKSRIVEE